MMENIYKSDVEDIRLDAANVNSLELLPKK